MTIHRLPVDVLWYLIVWLDADSAWALEGTCRMMHRTFQQGGWRRWLRRGEWHFASCPSAVLYAASRPVNPAAAAVTPLPCYTLGDAALGRLVKVGLRSDAGWRARDGRPRNTLRIPLLGRALGAVVRSDRDLVVWTSWRRLRWYRDTRPVELNPNDHSWPALPASDPALTNTRHIRQRHPRRHSQHQQQQQQQQHDYDDQYRSINSAVGADISDVWLEAERNICTVAGVNGDVASWQLPEGSNDARTDALPVCRWRATVASPGVQRLTAMPGTERMLLVSQDNQLRILDGRACAIDTDRVLHTTALPTRPWSVYVPSQGPHQHTAIVGLSGRTHALSLYALRPDGVQPLHTLPGHRASVYSVDGYEPVPEVVVSGSYDGQVRVWDLRLSPATACVSILEDRFDDTAVYCCRWDGRRVVAGTARHGALRIWDLRSPQHTMNSSHRGKRRWDHRLYHIDRAWSPVYSLCLEQTRILATLEHELWWLDYSS